jgi:hypothetical protein
MSDDGLRSEYERQVSGLRQVMQGSINAVNTLHLDVLAMSRALNDYSGVQKAHIDRLARMEQQLADSANAGAERQAQIAAQLEAQNRTAAEQREADEAGRAVARDSLNSQLDRLARRQLYQHIALLALAIAVAIYVAVQIW